MFGIGGILVELLEDGFRGKPKADVNAIVDALLKVSDLVVKYEEIHEMDLNPVLIYEKGLICVDARIILKKKEAND